MTTSPPPDDLFFTGAESPRDLDIIGEFAGKPYFFRFETMQRQSANGNAITMVSRNDDGPVASFNWLPGDHLGQLRVGQHTLPMASLVGPGITPNGRSFRTSEGIMYEWRHRNRSGQLSYSLFTQDGTRIATFENFTPPVQTPIGTPAHGVLRCKFSGELLLFQALLALSLNRWLDMFGF